MKLPIGSGAIEGCVAKREWDGRVGKLGHVPDLLKAYALDTRIGCISSSIQGFLS
jgi:hypothetical protein